jgi:predicted RNA polymerase sigma factor
VVYLVFTEGHQASTGSRVIRGELCDEAVRPARLLAGLRPEDPEVLGLLALLLLTDARRDARAGGSASAARGAGPQLQCVMAWLRRRVVPAPFQRRFSPRA